jgi:hypothetical protein
MTQTSLPQPHEQRKIEELLMKLSKMKPTGESAIRVDSTANAKVFFST